MKFQVLKVVILLLIQEVLCINVNKFFSNDWNQVYDPDMFRNVSGLISSKGYPVEDHTVQTADGYLLSMQRIPHGKNNLISGKKQVIYLQHGLLSAASDWVLNFPEQSLGFILADMGYDVWLGNTRGNTYSRHHIKLSPSMSAFWNFSFDQMAEYDLPAMIDYVLNVTEEKQLIYVGHSQGTTAAFALLSENRAYNKKIKLFMAFAPVSTVGYIRSAIKYLTPFTTDLEFLSELLGVNEFLPSTALMKFLSEKVCDTELKIICEDIMFIIFGFDKKEMNQTRVGVYTAHTPAGSSSKSVIHFAQMVNSKKFQKFDYGKHNRDYYNQTTPPEYDVSKITTPTALFWATNDYMADVRDVKLLEPKLKSLVLSYLIPDSDFNHGDFVFAMDARKVLYEEVLTVLKQYAD